MKSGVVSGEGVRPAADLLKDLVRVDTSVAGAGGEALAAQILARFLTQDGVMTHIYTTPDGQPAVIARVQATHDARAADPQARPGPLVIATHLDCHPFNHEGWLHDPLGGETADGAIWGRGAVNCKGPIAVWATLLAAAARSSRPRTRDLVLVAAGGGVGGTGCGLEWLYRQHGDLLAADAVIAQGGGWPMRLCGKTYYTFNFAERGTAVATIGRGAGLAAASAPALQAKGLPIRVSPHFEAFVDGLAASQPRPAASIIQAMLSPLLTEPAVYRLVNTPAERARLLAGARNEIRRVWADRHDLALDCLFLPGTTERDLAAELSEALGVCTQGEPADGTNLPPGEINVEVRLRASASPARHELLGAIAAAVARHAGGARLVPLISPHPTSCRVPRELGLPAYGFFPMLDSMTTADPHAPNERLSLAGLAFGLTVLRDVLDGYVVQPRRGVSAAPEPSARTQPVPR